MDFISKIAGDKPRPILDRDSFSQASSIFQSLSNIHHDIDLEERQNPIEQNQLYTLSSLGQSLELGSPIPGALDKSRNEKSLIISSTPLNPSVPSNPNFPLSANSTPKSQPKQLRKSQEPPSQTSKNKTIRFTERQGAKTTLTKRPFQTQRTSNPISDKNKSPLMTNTRRQFQVEKIKEIESTHQNKPILGNCTIFNKQNKQNKQQHQRSHITHPNKGWMQTSPKSHPHQQQQQQEYNEEEERDKNKHIDRRGNNDCSQVSTLRVVGKEMMKATMQDSPQLLNRKQASYNFIVQSKEFPIQTSSKDANYKYSKTTMSTTLDANLKTAKSKIRYNTNAADNL